ncbi:DUF6602 domain-containing protein [Sorangium sp. So ce362]|uniref:DUF6602 domain-containing protein n=1 Tax=Sorangium sp. So ce362 TaxID=3133303 RepID=UPI003F5F5A03
MLYDGWVEDIAKRFQRKLDEVAADYNFDYGIEFEISLAEVLRQVLPERAGVCRGFVVSRDGQKAGDDIIIYDKSRFPTLRSLGGRLERKERVPAEAVLAYIEAKYTLGIDGDGGQSLDKACRQLELVKRLPRFSGAGSLSPWYTAIIARGLRGDNSCAGGHAEQLAQRTDMLSLGLCAVPDVILAGQVIALPATIARDANRITSVHIRQTKTAETETVFVEVPGHAFGIAVLHLLWSIGGADNVGMPWEDMIVEALGGESARIFAVLAQPGTSLEHSWAR